MKMLSILIKPASSLCNMRCRYCFYADVSEHRTVPCYGVMSDEIRDALIDRVAEASPDAVTFAFQGGEPTVAGLSFFKGFVDRVKATLKKEIKVSYSIQTNGLLLDDAFCAFLKENSFLVGLSLDGYRENHDYMRSDAGGKETFSRTLAASRRLRKFGVDLNVLTVVTGPLAKRATKLWQFYRKNGFDFVQFIPCLSPLGETLPAEWALSPRLYASFLKELFPLWVEGLLNGRYISVRLFDNLVRQAAGQVPEMCGMCGNCSPQFVVEADGGVYPCDFYVLDEHLCGNLLDLSFDGILKHPNMQTFLAPSLPARCQNCRFGAFCHGSCKRYRSLYFAEERYCPYADFLSSCESELLAARRYVFGR